MNMLNQKQKIIVIIGGIIIIGILVFYYINSTKDIYEYDEISNTEIVEQQEEKEEIKNKIVIHITGAVTKEGIVSVNEDARIHDVIEAAVGLTQEADISNVNLAYAVEDGQKIYIPSKQDKEEVQNEAIITQEAGENILEENEIEKKTGLININKATQEELQEIPGVRKFDSRKNNYI